MVMLFMPRFLRKELLENLKSKRTGLPSPLSVNDDRFRPSSARLNRQSFPAIGLPNTHGPSAEQ